MDAQRLSSAQLDRIVYKATLAPSPHNVQGWKFRWDGRKLAVIADENYRIMRELDPQEKEGAIALGAAVENVVLAAAEEGFLAHVTWLPESGPDLTAAWIAFERLGDTFVLAADRELGTYIERRAINRSKYTSQPISDDQLRALQEIAASEGFDLITVTEQEKIGKFARLAGEAGQFKFSHEPTHRELYHYLRFTAKETAAKRDGLPLEQFNIPPWLARFGKIGMNWQVVRWMNMLGYHRVLSSMQEKNLVNSAPAVCMLRSKDGERASFLQGGRVLQRLWLAAAKYGLAVQPHSAVADLTYARQGGYDASISAGWQQRIDQFPQRLRDIFAVSGEMHVVNLFRLGYPSRTLDWRSQRRPMDHLLETIEFDGNREQVDTFYRELTKRNAPFISHSDQRVLRTGRIAVAGCGSIGGASLEVLARMGAERFLLAEPDHFEINNLNRQNATLDDIGKHKAEAILDRVQLINPHIKANILKEGLTPHNLQYFVGSSAVVIDGVDITERSALKVKIMLHEEAWRQRKTVICGYDIAGTQLLRVYDYGNGKTLPLHGKFRNAELDGITPLGFLSKVISPLDLPLEMLPVTKAMIQGTQGSIPQLGPTATLFGVLSAWAALDVLAGRPVRHKIRIDIPASLRPRSENGIKTFRRLAGIIKLKLILNKTKSDSRKQVAKGSVRRL